MNESADRARRTALPSRRAFVTGLAAVSATALGSGTASASEPTASDPPVTVIDIRAHGADGSGTGDPIANTTAINKALKLLTDNSVLYIPAGTYLVAPPLDNQASVNILKIPAVRNLTIRGDGPASVLKVADAPPEATPRLYGSVLGFTTPEPETLFPDRVTFCDFAVDHNRFKNPLPVLNSAPEPKPVLGSSISTYTGVLSYGDIEVRNVHILNADSRVSLYFPGQKDLERSVSIVGCRWINAGCRTSKNNDDQSFINATCSTLTVQSCYFHGTDWVKAPRTAIETHASNTLIQGNVIERFQIGVNITGNANHRRTTYRHLCQDNILNVSRDGVLIWSHRYDREPRPVLGFEDMTVSGNHVTVNPDKYVPPFEGRGLRGIGVYAIKDQTAPPNLGFRNLVIADNTIRYPLESTVPPYLAKTEVGQRAGAICFGFGGTTAADDTYENVRITNNTVSDCAFSGLLIDGGTWNGLQIDGNTFTNCGHTTQATRAVHNRVPLYVAAALASDCVISGNVFFEQDQRAPGAPAPAPTALSTFIRVEQQQAKQHRFVIAGNVFSIDRAITDRSSIGQYVTPIGEHTLWTFDGAVPRADIALTPTANLPQDRPSALGGVGSRVRINDADLVATKVGPALTAWQRQGFAGAKPAGGTWAAGDVVINTAVSASNPALQWVCVAGGSAAQWREI